MSLAISPDIANLFIGDFEEMAVTTIIKKPTIWLRYVDDVLAIWPHGRDELPEFLSAINKIHTKIDFVMELEEKADYPS